MCVQLAEQDAQKHAGLVKSLSKEIGEFEAPDMPSLVEYVRNTSARLGVIMTDEAAVLAQFPTWPQVPPSASCASGLQATGRNPCYTLFSSDASACVDGC